MKTKYRSSLTRRWQHCIYICLAALAMSSATIITARAQGETSDPLSPVLISENDSTRALAMSANKWRGSLPKSNVQSFQPGEESRAILFATNLDLIEGEGADAFRVYAQDRTGKIYRLTVENIEPLRKEQWIFAITVRLYDENGYNGQPAGDGDVLLRLTWRGLTSNRVVFGLGDSTSKIEIKNDEDAVPTPAPTYPPTKGGLDFAYNNAGDRARFMEQAAFGQNPTIDFRLRQIGAQRWVNEQISKPFPTFAYPNLPLKASNSDIGCPANVPDGQPDPVRNACYRDFYSEYQLQRWMFNEALYGNDQLRRRVSWALHQMWVVSGNNTDQARWQLEYIKLLDQHAFGNYRALMGEMTHNPAMGNYLDMMRSTRQSPNENYPREILQLFTVGLDELNLNGTPKMNGSNRIPTYDQNKIVEFTKVFTGWTLCNQNPPTCPNAVTGAPNYVDDMVLNVGVTTPSVANPGNHNIGIKTLFTYPGAPFSTIAACTNCTDGPTGAQDIIDIKNYAEDSLSKTLDNIYNHPNLAPFVSKRLIQHLVTSDPSPAYVQRVATVFNNNRTSSAQMGEVIKAILFDVEARGSRKTAPDYGKLREPFQFVSNILRQFNVRASGAIGNPPAAPPAACQNRSDGYINNQTVSMAQNIWNPTTVFSYFSPDYIIPGTDIVGPEFAILDTGTTFRRINFVNTMVFGQVNYETTSATNPFPNAPCGTSIDLTEPQNWATADPTGNALVDGLNNKMMHGAMSAAMKQKILVAIDSIPAAQTNAARDRARQAVYLVATSSQYQVQR